MFKEYKYQIALLGGNATAKSALRDLIERRFQELGIDCEKHVAFLNSSSSPGNLGEYDPAAPTVGVYFEDATPTTDLDFVSKLTSRALVVIPVFSDETKYLNSFPPALHPINGLKFNGSFDKLADLCLEGLGLLRRSRRLFISYRRQESSIAASQLHESLNKSGFDVFLDTASIPPGDNFQEVLLHRLSNTDVAVVLDTPNFFDSRWTQKEIEEASAMSIGLLRLVWPNSTPKDSSGFFERIYLDGQSDFSQHDSGCNNPLTAKTLKKITVAVEAVRARSFASRYNNLVNEFGKAAAEMGYSIAIQINRHIFVAKTPKEYTLAVPVIGVPDAVDYHEISTTSTENDNTNAIKTVLLYDHRNIREAWRQHLAWLDKHLPIRSVPITGVMEWLKNL